MQCETSASPSLAARTKLKSLVITHRPLHALGPVYLQKSFSFYTPTRHLRSSIQLLAHVPRFRRHRLGGTSLALKAAIAWNPLPVALRSIQDPTLFKRNLKTFLFK